jgi:hypothetical protein
MTRTVEMNKMVDSLATHLFGMTIAEAIEKGVCIQCKRKALPRCPEWVNVKEYAKSGLCAKCFNEITEV